MSRIGDPYWKTPPAVPFLVSHAERLLSELAKHMGFEGAASEQKGMGALPLRESVL
jgi:hypothetical protein